LTRTALPAARQQALIDAVLGLDELPAAKRLTELLRVD
jgi:hypothetical protein